MSQKSPAELNDIEQPMEELTPEQAEQAEGGIIIVGGKFLVTTTNPATTGIPGNPIDPIALNPQPLPPFV